MADKDLTEIVTIVDRSGSMQTMKAEAIGGFNTFLDAQKKVPGKARLTLVLFDHEYLLVHNGKPISDVPPLDETSYVPRGTTALLDAVGRAIDDVGLRLAETPEEHRPGKIIVLVLTDGHENSSHDYSAEHVRRMVQRQRETYSWEFVFLGANLDAPQVAASMNIPHSASFAASVQGTKQAYAGITRAATSYRLSNSVDPNWSVGVDGASSSSDVTPPPAPEKIKTLPRGHK